MDADGIRLTSYFRERQRVAGRPLATALASLYARPEIAASIVVRGTGGSMTATAVGLRPDTEAILGQVAELTSPGLVTMERVRLLTGDIDPVWLGVEPGEATTLTVYCGGKDQVYQVPAFEAVCELLYRRGIAGATVVPGVDGTAHGLRQHPQFLRPDASAPLMIIAVDPGNEIGMLLPELGALFRHPVMTVEKVQVCKRGGQLISRPQAPFGEEPPGTTALLKLTVHASEDARHDGQQAHRAILRAVGPTGIESLSTMRGIWGFHADHPPHGDHFPRRGRHVPPTTVVTGTPEQIAAALDAVGPLTAEAGLVTVQTVLAMRPAADRVRP